MEKSCGRTCNTDHPAMEKAGKLIGSIVKITITAIVFFTLYQQFLK